MILKKLTLEGFKSYKNRTMIDFTRMPLNQLFLIQGKTGAGKSTILDAITFALYSSGIKEFLNQYLTNSIKEDLIKNSFQYKGKEIARVELIFDYQNETYKITKTIKVKNFRKENPDIESICELESKIYKGNSEISQILFVEKLSENQFKKSIIIPQNQFDKFLKANAKEKEEILKTIFNTSKYDEFVHFIKRKLEITKQEVEKIETTLKRILEKHEIEKTFEDPNIMIEFDKKIGVNEEKINKTNQKLEKLKSENSEKQNVLNKKKALKEDLEELCKLYEKQNQLNLKESTIKEKKIALENAKKVIEIYPVYQKIKELEEKIHRQNQELNNTKKELEQIERNLIQANRNLDILNNKKGEFDYKKTLLEKKNEILSQMNSLKITLPQIERVKSIKSQKEEKLGTLKQRLEELNSQLEEIYRSLFAKQLQANEPCPVCGSLEHPEPFQGKLHDDPEKILEEKKNLEKTINTLDKEINDLAKQIHENELNISSIKNYIEENYDTPDLNQIENSLKSEIKELSNNISTYEDELKKTQKEYNRLIEEKGKKQGRIHQLEEILKANDEELKRLKGELTTLLQKENIVEGDIEKFYLPKMKMEQLEKEITEFENKKTEIASQINQIKGKIPQSIVNIHEEPKTVLAKVQKKITELDNEISKLEEEIRRKESEIKSLLEEIGRLKEKNENLNKDKKTFKEEKSKYTTYLKKYRLHEMLYKILSDQKISYDQNAKAISFHRYIIQIYFETVIKYANLRLKKIEPRYLLKATEDPQLGKRLAGLNIKVLDKFEGERNIEGLSGGETFYTSLALALGLYDIIHSNLSHVKFDFLFIDEGFGSLDEHTLQKVLSTLNKIFISQSDSSQKQVGLISHVESMKQQIANQIIIENRNGVSSVKYYP